MPKFGNIWFNGYYFGDDKPPYVDFKKAIGRVELGLNVRKQIGKRIIFRVQKSDTRYGVPAGKLLQDKYKYFVPPSINNAESEPYRRQWIAAVHKWIYDLTDTQKKAYNKRANKGLRMSGYNLFMREAMKGLVEMYVDRGEALGYDFQKGDLTTDATWRELDLSSLVPKGAKAVLLRVDITDDLTTSVFSMRKCGNTETYNSEKRFTKHANFLRYCAFIVACDVNRKVDYWATAVEWTTINIIVRGWWT